MSKATSEDLGIQAVEKVFELYGIDAEWSTREERGFSWWAHNYRQQIWSEPGFDDDGIVVYRLCAKTDFLKDVPNNPELPRKLATLSMFATMAAQIYDPRTQTLSLFSSVYIHEQTAPIFVPRLFATSAIVQPIESQIRANMASELLGGEPDSSEHPESGERLIPDEMLGVISKVYRPVGEKTSPWLGSDAFEQAAEFLNRSNSFANAGPSGLTAEFPFGSETTSMLQAFGDIINPQLGSGLMLQLRLPVTLSETETAETALYLNFLETSECTLRHMVGSWTVDPSNPKTLVFASFLPAILHDEYLLINLSADAARRSLWAGEVFVGDDAGGSVIDVVTRRYLRIFPADGSA
jgi:hypothetical protein